MFVVGIVGFPEPSVRSGIRKRDITKKIQVRTSRVENELKNLSGWAAGYECYCTDPTTMLESKSSVNSQCCLISLSMIQQNHNMRSNKHNGKSTHSPSPVALSTGATWYRRMTDVCEKFHSPAINRWKNTGPWCTAKILVIVSKSCFPATAMLQSFAKSWILIATRPVHKRIPQLRMFFGEQRTDCPLRELDGLPIRWTTTPVRRHWRQCCKEQLHKEGRV